MSANSQYMEFQTSDDNKLKCKSDLHIARKIWHFLGIMVIAVIFHNVTRPMALATSFLIALTLLSIDFIRLRNASFNKLFVKVTKPIMREREMYTYTGSTALFFGVFIIIYLFPAKIVTLSLLCLGTADPVAGYFGVKYGKDRITGNKTLQGSMAAFACCTLVSLVFYLMENSMTDRILIVSLLTGLCGALSELIKIGRFDDNLTFPILNSFFLWGLFNIFGA